MSRSPVVHRLVANLASEHSKKNPDPDRIIALKAAIAEERLADFITRTLSTAPPLSAEAKGRITALVDTLAGAA